MAKGKRTSSPAQKAAQARLTAASRKASSEGLKGQAFKNRVKALLKGTGGGRTKKKGGGGSKKPRKSSSKKGGFVKSTKKAGKGFMVSLSPKRIVSAALVIDGAVESFNNAQRTWASPWEKAQQVLMPLADGVLAAKTFHKAASSPATAPGLIGDLWNWRPFSGQTPNITLRRAVNALPSGTGWWLGINRYRQIRKVESRVNNLSLLPRMASMTGIKLRNAKAVGGAWLAAAETGASGPRDLANAVLNGPVTPVLIGAGGSKLLAKAHVF